MTFDFSDHSRNFRQLWECWCAGFRYSHIQDLRVILQRCFPTGLRLLVRAHEEVVLAEAEEVLSGSGCRWTVLSWRRSRGPDSAACCGGLKVRRCGSHQHECDMVDLEMYSFRRAKMRQFNHHDLSHKHAFTFVRATEQTVWTSCTLWVCILCTPPVELSVLRSRNPKPDNSAYTDRKLLKQFSFTVHHIARNATTMTSIAKWNLAMM